MSAPRVRRWCFTNYKLEFDYEAFMKTCQVPYVFYGLEKCPSTGNMHHQGWCYFKNPQSSYKKVGAMMGLCHVEACNGSAEQNKKYCEKDGIVTEIGDPPSQGARCDLKALFEEMEQGKTNEEILDDTPQLMHQYGRVIDQKRAVMNRKIVRSWHTTCEWAYGPTGTGKTYHWKSIWDAEKMWVYKLNDRGWCDGYRGQPIVIINEIRAGDIPYRELLNMIDECPHWLPNRCNEPIPFMAKHIYITSPYRPEDVYCDLSGEDKIEQLTDRIALRHFTGPSKRKRCKNIFLHDVSKELDGLCEEETYQAGGSQEGTCQHEDG